MKFSNIKSVKNIFQNHYQIHSKLIMISFIYIGCKKSGKSVAPLFGQFLGRVFITFFGSPLRWVKYDNISLWPPKRHLSPQLPTLASAHWGTHLQGFSSSSMMISFINPLQWDYSVSWTGGDQLCMDPTWRWVNPMFGQLLENMKLTPGYGVGRLHPRRGQEPLLQSC